MPKSPKGKKRKLRTKKEKKKKNPKRLKFDEDEDNILGDFVLSSSNSEEEDEDVGGNLEKMLEKNAEKNNLTAINVKSILHHVVTDKRVRDLVQKVIAEEAAKEMEKQSEETNSLEDIDLDFPEPKMTRSKFKQKHQDDPIAQLTKSPIKIYKPISTFTDLDFPESSSDEEYDPGNDEEDEDTESFVSNQSDLASPFKPGTPDSQQSDIPFESDSAAPTTSGGRPITRHRLQEALFKKPESVSTAMTPEKEDLIAKRTRSHLLINDPLEFGAADVMLPDYMPDLYDTIKPDDLDKEDIDFQIFLQRLINGDDEDTVTEDEDMEYDFMAENHKEEKEEYRNDRAVRIPKQEVSDLFEELLTEFDENGGVLDGSAMLNTRALLLDSEEGDKNAVLFSELQRAQLSAQMSQHLQILCQIFLLSREDPTLQDEAETCRQYINELQGFSERASSAHYVMALKTGIPSISMFEVAELPEAVRIVKEPFNAVKRPRSPRKHAAVTSSSSGRNKPRGPCLPLVSSTNQAIMANSSLFQREELLPRCGFNSKDPNWTKDPSCLRVKFTETEDNLLALGMKQFQRNWKLIQTHLLPVKTPKQLQIRCKNLLSNRAQMNVVKHLRQTNTMWALPTKVRANSSPDVNRRRSSSDSPDWLISYRHKLKNSRKQLPSKSTQAEYPSQKETIEPSSPHSAMIITLDTSATGVDVAPHTLPMISRILNQNVDENVHSVLTVKTREGKDSIVANLGGKKKEHNPSINTNTSVESCKNPNDITQDNSSDRALSLDIAVSSNDSNKDKEDKQMKNEPSLSMGRQLKNIEREHEISNSDNPEEDEHSKPKTPCPEELSPEISPEKCSTGDQQEEHMDVDAVLNSEPLGDVEQDPKMQCPSNSTDDDQNKNQALVWNDIECTSQESFSATQEIPNDKTAKSPPVAPATKNKGTREKSTISSMSSSAPNTSKKSCVGSIPLDPDPKGEIRAQALADSYMAKVKKTLKNDQIRYEEFLRALVTSSTNQWTPVQLYNRMEVVLSEYPELVEDFIAFLEPEEALEAGVLMENLEFVRARTFLRRLEVHFHKTPSHFKKIIKAFSSWNAGDKTPTELHEKLIPLLRGQQHLIDEFQTFFDNLKPPICSEEDFEEVEIGSDSDFEVDDFEEVVIPDVIEPKKPKGKAQAKLRQTSGTARTTCTGNRQKITPRPTATTNTITTTTTRTKQEQVKPSRRRNRPVDGAKKSPAHSEGEEEIGNKMLQGGGSIERNYKDLSSPQQKSTERERSVECDELTCDQNPSSVFTEGSASDGPHSVTSSCHNETSNDSLKYDDRYEFSHNNKPNTTSGDDVIDDVSNDANESENDDNIKNEEYSYDARQGRANMIDARDDQQDDVSTDVTENENDDNDDSDNYDVIVDEGTDDTGDDGVEFQQRVISARNHLLGHDGQLVVLWTREDDRTILSICHDQGATGHTFENLSKTLIGKSAAEIKSRFDELMKLYQADSKDPSSSEDEDEDEDSEGSEPETDS